VLFVTKGAPWIPPQIDKGILRQCSIPYNSLSIIAAAAYAYHCTITPQVQFRAIIGIPVTTVFCSGSY
jgi:hypothetical protein